MVLKQDSMKSLLNNILNTKRPKIVQEDNWLIPCELDIIARTNQFKALTQSLEQYFGSLENFASAYRYFGFNYDKKKKGWYYREWAPEAKALYLVGDFNDWDRKANPMTKDDMGVWTLFLEDKKYAHKFIHKSLLKVLIHNNKGEIIERIPAYIKRVIQDKKTANFTAQHWYPQTPFKWTDEEFLQKDLGNLFIYEAHIGMAQEEAKVGTYREFADTILPRIQQAGYNTVQLMAIAEHPYYGSYGYHVSNFYAPSSRFGTPEDLKYLINQAHKMGIGVIMDLVHSHAVKNILEGLNEFDGTAAQYFHDGERTTHPDWDSKLFNYGKWEVMQFLASNIRYWLEEFHFDGFRFDGISSILYLHHGHQSFDSVYKYFRKGVDNQAILYLQLANTIAQKTRKGVITIAEDVSGMPGLTAPIEDGGIGFGYRLGMGLPDFWIKMMQKPDEKWDMNQIWETLNNRQPNVNTVAYVESHDQALVGDKTLAFRLMDKEMYDAMDKASHNLVVDRGIALHKMIRLITISAGGQAYMNFIGNEFGHPEWIDFPRAGNHWSCEYARRKWSLRDNGFLRYHYLADFDKAMLELIRENQILQAGYGKALHMDDLHQTLIFEKGNLIFVFNFHPTNSTPNYPFRLPFSGKFELILNSDDKKFGGFGRIKTQAFYAQYNSEDEYYYLNIYNVNRTCQVLKKIDEFDALKM